MMSSFSGLRREASLLALVLFVFGFAICGFRPLSVPDEGRYPEIAREMLLTGDYVTPHLNGVVFLDKPVLYYWLQTVSYRLLGVNTWSVRLMPVLSGVAGAVLVFIAGWQLFSRRAAYLAVAALVCNPLYFGASQYANMDLEVAIWISATLLLFLLARQTQTPAGRWCYWAAYVCMGCAVLTKGLIGAVFPLMIIGAWMVLGWRWREMRHWQIPSGIAIFLLVCLPWYVAVQKENPGFFHYFFIYQQFERFANSGFNNALPFWFYVPVIVAGMLPWSFWLPHAFYNQWRASVGKASLDASGVRPLLLLWVVLILVFFSIPQSKIVGYILPVLPPLALLLGDYLDRKLVWAGTAPGFALRQLRVFAIIGIVLGLVVLVAVPRAEKETIRKLAILIKDTVQPGDIVVNYRNYNQDLLMYWQPQQPVFIVEDWDNRSVMQEDNWHHDLDYGMQQNPDSRRWLITESGFAGKLNTATRVYVLAKARDEAKLGKTYALQTLARTPKNVLMVSPSHDARMPTGDR